MAPQAKAKPEARTAEVKQKEIPDGIEPWQMDIADLLAQDIDEKAVRYNIEVVLPCLELPHLSSGESRIAKQSIELVASRVLVTNCSDMCKVLRESLGR